jgi:CubicO group peptidase (beta-lactamase class C family)
MNIKHCIYLAAGTLMGSTVLGIAQSNSADESLVGLWGVERNFGPEVRGELTLEAHGASWRARIGAYSVAVERNGDALTFTLPGDRGELRAHIAPDQKSIVGNWIQPANGLYNNKYASPAVLSAIGRNVWRGQVVPLQEPLSLYTSIERAPDGSLTAFVRNPEFNLFRGRIFRVALKDGAVTFSQDGGELHGSYDSRTDRLTLSLLRSLPPFIFTRRRNHDAVGFYPRSSTDSTGYVYHQPVGSNDGWPTTSLSQMGLRKKPLVEMVEQILTANVADNPLPMHSLLIARHGNLVFEEYFYGFTKEKVHDTRSAGKTWATMLVGVARQHGANLGPETPVYPLFPSYQPIAHWDDRKAKLTLRDLMTMTSGLACDDNDSNSPGQEGQMQSQTLQPDWYKYTLDLPMARDPGGDNGIYCSADINLVGGVVRQVTGRWLPDLFQKDFAQPLQIAEYHLNLMPTGEAYMGGGLYMRPRDLLKLGQLYLNGGIWNGKRVVGKDWVEESTRRASNISDPIGMDHQYGFAWHIYHFDVQGKTYRMFFAGGNGGQLVMIFPELDMVAAYNGGAYGESKKFFRWQALLVPQYIIPAAIEQETK